MSKSNNKKAMTLLLLEVLCVLCLAAATSSRGVLAAAAVSDSIAERPLQGDSESWERDVGIGRGGPSESSYLRGSRELGTKKVATKNGNKVNLCIDLLGNKGHQNFVVLKKFAHLFTSLLSGAAEVGTCEENGEKEGKQLRSELTHYHRFCRKFNTVYHDIVAPEAARKWLKKKVKIEWEKSCKDAGLTSANIGPAIKLTLQEADD